VRALLLSHLLPLKLETGHAAGEIHDFFVANNAPSHRGLEFGRLGI